jgi:UDP-N-acetylglucosamine 2-epimerase (non-hydrolysing)
MIVSMMRRVRILSVVGARPQFVKLAPIAAAVTAAGHEHVIVHTGQHYDPELSGVFFSGLGIPEPDEQLHVGPSPSTRRTGYSSTATRTPRSRARSAP